MIKHYFGEFNRNGYSIYCEEERDQDPVYQAGNCIHNSSQYLPPDEESTLDIATIEEFCDLTGKEIAEEYGGIWKGCGRIDDYEFDKSLEDQAKAQANNEIIAAIERGVKRVVETERVYHLYVTPEQRDLINRTALAIRDELVKD